MSGLLACVARIVVIVLTDSTIVTWYLLPYYLCDTYLVWYKGLCFSIVLLYGNNSWKIRYLHKPCPKIFHGILPRAYVLKPK